MIASRAPSRHSRTRRSAPKSASGWRYYCKKEKNDEPVAVIVALLLAGALGLLYFPWSGKGAVDRDAPNRALYQSRLQELAQERGEDNPALVVELARTLLTDTPAAAAAWRTAAAKNRQRYQRAAAGPSLGLYLKNQRYWPGAALAAG
ncbi:c-type cytochrome biogenesis protein CcmI [Klebsiella pneumoniae]|nr:c-type cytochrome biogenesis protein CcmI [Klebsiella pneumoniae]